MTNISTNNIITLHRGDTFSAPIYININTKLHPEYYALGDYDTVYISIMEPNKDFEDGIIRQVLTKDDFDFDKHAWLNLVSADTMKLLPGTYYYEIKLKLSNDAIATIVPKRKFIIL